MYYRVDRYGNKLSVLGFGCMRFQRKAGRIDMDEMEKEILLAIEQGVNYFDTAYIYPGSEAALDAGHGGQTPAAAEALGRMVRGGRD